MVFFIWRLQRGRQVGSAGNTFSAKIRLRRASEVTDRADTRYKKNIDYQIESFHLSKWVIGLASEAVAGRSEGTVRHRASAAAGTGQLGHLRIAHLTLYHLVHNLRVGANSAWAYSVPPSPYHPSGVRCVASVTATVFLSSNIPLYTVQVQL